MYAAGTNEDWLARSWQTEDGLPNNSVEGVAQTTDGYLWVGTPTGLSKFDGLHFETVSLTNLIPLPNRGIIAMIRGRSSTLWLAMDRGAVVRLSGNTSRAFIKDLPNLIPNGMAEDAQGGLWIAYRGGSVYHVTEDAAKEVTTEQGMPAGIGICALATDTHGRVWFAKSGQVGVYTNGMFHTVLTLDRLASMRLAAARDGTMWICSNFHVYKGDAAGNLGDFGEFHPDNPGTVATVMMEDQNGDVWIGTSFSGLYRCDKSGFQFIPTSHNSILCLAEDREGNIWVGTFGGGLNSIRRRAITLEGAGLPFPSVQSICEGGDGSLWAATQNGVLVHRVADRWEPVPLSDQWPGGATCVTCDSQGAIWIGTRDQNGLYCWRDGKFVDLSPDAALRGRTLHTLVAGKNGDIWIGQELPSAVLRLRNGKLTMFPIAFTNRIIRAMAEDAAGNIWVGTSKGVLLRVSGDQITDVTPRAVDDLAPIRCLYPTADGAVWIGYAGWGVGCLLGGHYSETSSSQGLFDDSISHIVDDGQGWLWFGADRGIFKVREQDFEDLAAGRIARVRSVHYGRGEGLPSLQGTFGASPDVLRSEDGRLWIPMQTGLVVADPAKLYENTLPPLTLLTRVTVDDRVVAQYEGILPKGNGGGQEIERLMAKDLVLHLPPGHRTVKFEYAAFDFNAPENIQFRHQLKGVEDDWVADGTARAVIYQRLDKGSYTFQVTACNSDGDWNKTDAEVKLDVAPFFWRTWWFQLIVVAAFTISIIAVVRYVSFRRLHAQLRRLEQQAALQRERARIAKDIHDDLGANLTQIAFLGELANQDREEPNAVGERIRKISATARQAVKSLDEIVWAVNPRNDTLAHLLDYAGQFAVDYLRLIGIRCRLDFPVEIPPRELSTDLRHNLFLSVKEALHNIFKHANATEVWLRAVADEQALKIVIEDNGCGFANAPDDALADGLRNMKQRMEEIGGSFRVESQPGSGTKIILHLPWHRIE
jgi:signal transduction histidine kinase/ligand-binding sensor domain-containing protein